MKSVLAVICGVAAVPAIRQAIKSYRAKKAIADVVVDAVEAGLDAVEKP
jgi:uncharacterized membrane protein YadS